jgi:hypothetical protein
MKKSTIAGNTALAILLLFATACQTGGSASEVAETTDSQLNVATAQSASEQDGQPGAAAESSPQGQQIAFADDEVVAQGNMACHIQLAGGPPSKPARGADFGKAIVKNTGKNVQRNVIQRIGGHFGGGLGAVVSGAVANSTIRNEEDIKGIWMITDGATGCACNLRIDGMLQLQGRGKDAGSVVTEGCNTPAIASIAKWALGYSFAGYDAKFDLKAKDNRSVLATLNRDGIHYFSGTLADGTAVTMWRDGQNYMQMKAGN